MDNQDDVIERVIDQESARVFHVKTVLGYTEDFADPGQEIRLMERVVPVFSGRGAGMLGYAALSFEGRRLVADLFLDYASEERLLIETRQQRLYAYFRTNSTSTPAALELYPSGVEIDGPRSGLDQRSDDPLGIPVP